jgi:hypothetical protein
MIKTFENVQELDFKTFPGLMLILKFIFILLLGLLGL